ncbi:MAG: right-handed parallel beta-helix repeat-containing protein, partial [bacterium]
LRECVIEANDSASWNGGGVYGYQSGIVIENSLVVRNRGPRGGGIFANIGCDLQIQGSTIAGNSAAYSAGGIYVELSHVSVRTSVLRDNCAGGVTDLLTSGPVVIECSAIQLDNMRTEDSGSIAVLGPQVPDDPRFCDPWPCPTGTPLPGGDYHLRSDSPCLPQFSPCGELIGALGEECAAPEPVGACCLPDGTCVLRTDAACVAAGGLYQGGDFGCYPDPCVPTPTESTSWGRIKAAYR